MPPRRTAARYKHIAFVASAGAEAQQALAQLAEIYGNHDPADADVVVALGGDGLMLQTLHRHMRSGKPIYGMHRGTVGFLMNEYSTHDLHDPAGGGAGIRDPSAVDARHRRRTARCICTTPSTKSRCFARPIRPRVCES